MILCNGWIRVLKDRVLLSMFHTYSTGFYCHLYQFLPRCLVGRLITNNRMLGRFTSFYDPGRQPSIEDELPWKMTFDWRLHLIWKKDNLFFLKFEQKVGNRVVCISCEKSFEQELWTSVEKREVNKSCKQEL